MAHKIIVIGGTNLDISGIPSDALKMHDSNIGTISFSAGGVSRNIAVNLRKLGADVSLLTALGNDQYSSIIREDLEKNGIDYSLSLVSSVNHTGMYLYISGQDGDMLCAINDMNVVSEITPEYIDNVDFSPFDACVVDANLSRSVLEHIADTVNIPIYADPVSTVKARKLAGLHFTAIKPNLIESEVLTPFTCDRTYVSKGENGMDAFSSGEKISIEGKHLNIKNATGAGDAAMAAIIVSELSGMDMEECAKFAVEYSASVL